MSSQMMTTKTFNEKNENKKEGLLVNVKNGAF